MKEEIKQEQIDHRVIKLLLGLIALGLAFVSQVLSGVELKSISESYYYSSRDYFVGSLFAVSALFLTFRGKGFERILTIIASCFAVIIAIAPCACGQTEKAISAIHFPAAIGLFGILGYFCWAFRDRASSKVYKYPEAKIRMKIYSICFGGMMLVFVAAILYKTNQVKLDQLFPAYIFWVEALGLVSFGTSWLVASKIFPFLANERERYRIFEKSAIEDEIDKGMINQSPVIIPIQNKLN